MKKILIVDDDADLCVLLCEVLKGKGFNPFWASKFREAVNLIARELPDLIVLDIGLPDGNGINLCRQLKALPRTRRIAVMILSGTSSKRNFEESLAARMDHFMSKPIENLSIFTGWAQALLNRIEYEERSEGIIKAGHWRIEPILHSLNFKDHAVFDLTTKEFDFLYLLMENCPKPVSRRMLLRRLWGNHPVYDNNLHLLATRLRKKLADSGFPAPFENLYGLGFKFLPNSGNGASFLPMAIDRPMPPQRDLNSSEIENYLLEGLAAADPRQGT